MSSRALQHHVREALVMNHHTKVYAAAQSTVDPVVLLAHNTVDPVY
jgi:hypothetical protein